VSFNDYPDTGTLSEQEDAFKSKGTSLPLIAALVSATVAFLTASAAIAYRRLADSKATPTELIGDVQDNQEFRVKENDSCSKAELVRGIDDETLLESSLRCSDDLLSDVSYEDIPTHSEENRHFAIPSTFRENHDENDRSHEKMDTPRASSDLQPECTDETMSRIGGDAAVAEDDVALYYRTDSEDEDVPLRVVDLIRIFTPQRPLEPPGNAGRR